MSTKSKSQLEIHSVLRKFGDLVMNLETGEELPSAQSLTVALSLPSLGVRVERYMRNPSLVQDRYNNPDLWTEDEVDEHFDEMEDGSLRPISPHTESYQAALAHRKDRLDKERSAADAAALEKAAQDKADFRRRVQEAKADIDIEQDVKSIKEPPPK